MRPPIIFIIMGVAGTGKSTVGLKLSQALGCSFRDGDDFHPASNLAKMAAGIPLDDRDRDPFLAAIRAEIAACLARGESAVFACSALKQNYRQILAVDPERVKWVYLTGDPALIRARLGQRPGHFMKPEMLASQFAALEPPADALALDIADAPDALVAAIRTSFAI